MNPIDGYDLESLGEFGEEESEVRSRRRRAVRVPRRRPAPPRRPPRRPPRAWPLRRWPIGTGVFLPPDVPVEPRPDERSRSGGSGGAAGSDFDAAGGAEPFGAPDAGSGFDDAGDPGGEGDPGAAGDPAAAGEPGGSEDAAEELGWAQPSRGRPAAGGDVQVDAFWVQECLNRALALRLPLTGTMDAATRSGVRSFQRRAGLPVDGRVDAATGTALAEAGQPGCGGRSAGRSGDCGCGCSKR